MTKEDTADRGVNCADCGERCFGPTFNFGRVQCGTCFFDECRREQAGTFPFVGLTLEEARRRNNQ